MNKLAQLKTMTTKEKLAEGSRNFANDALKLEEFACAKCSSAKRNAANFKRMCCGSKSRVLTLDIMF